MCALSRVRRVTPVRIVEYDTERCGHIPVGNHGNRCEHDAVSGAHEHHRAPGSIAAQAVTTLWKPLIDRD